MPLACGPPCSPQQITGESWRPLKQRALPGVALAPHCARLESGRGVLAAVGAGVGQDAAARAHLLLHPAGQLRDARVHAWLARQRAAVAPRDDADKHRVAAALRRVDERTARVALAPEEEVALVAWGLVVVVVAALYIVCDLFFIVV